MSRVERRLVWSASVAVACLMGLWLSDSRGEAPGEIKTRMKSIYRIQINFKGSKIRRG